MKVYDLFLAAALIIEWQMFESVEVFERKWAYIFPDTKAVQDIADKYNFWLLKVDPNDLKNKRNALKAKIYQSGGRTEE